MVTDTIFAPSFGNRPKYLVGRESIISDFLKGLDGNPGNRERSIVLLGQRGSGKTVLLWELADRAAERGFVVATPTVLSEGLLVRIVEKIQEDGSRYVKSPGASIAGACIGALGFSAGLEFSREIQETKSPQYKLTQLARKLSKLGHGILILVDELQANSTEIRQLVTVYQEMIGEGLDLALVMAGLPGAVSATLNDHVLTFLNRARKISLDPLKINEVDTFFARAFESLGVEIDAQKRRFAAEFTYGSPYMLQLVGHYLIIGAQDEGTISDDAFNDALYSAQEDFENDICSITLKSLSPRDIDFLTAMTLDEEASKVSDIAERMSCTIDYAQKYRRRLIARGVIEPAGRGLVVFSVPFLRDHLRKQ